MHALLADAEGVWAWTPGHWQAAATRHTDLKTWIDEHPYCDVKLWVSGDLLRSVGSGERASPLDTKKTPTSARDELVRRYGDAATTWALTGWTSDVAEGACALAGIDLVSLTRHAHQHHVRLRSVVPWWYHAFSQAKRCVNALSTSEHADVCVVEGRQLVWVSMVRGSLADVQQATLADATVAALGDAICTVTSSQPLRPLPVVLGQGLTDGARTGGLQALVLGRLDGEQPPHWLQPGSTLDAR